MSEKYFNDLNKAFGLPSAGASLVSEKSSASQSQNTGQFVNSLTVKDFF